MKNKFIILTAALFAVSSVFSACHKDDDDDNPRGISVLSKKVVKINKYTTLTYTSNYGTESYTDTTVYNFEYNKNNQITKLEKIQYTEGRPNATITPFLHTENGGIYAYGDDIEPLKFDDDLNNQNSQSFIADEFDVYNINFDKDGYFTFNDNNELKQENGQIKSIHFDGKLKIRQSNDGLLGGATLDNETDITLTYSYDESELISNNLNIDLLWIYPGFAEYINPILAETIGKRFKNLPEKVVSTTHYNKYDDEKKYDKIVTFNYTYTLTDQYIDNIQERCSNQQIYYNGTSNSGNDYETIVTTNYEIIYED